MDPRKQPPSTDFDYSYLPGSAPAGALPVPGSAANAASRRQLQGPEGSASIEGWPPAPIDAGFENHTEFDRGRVDMRRGVSSDLDLSSLQRPLTFSQYIASAATIAVCLPIFPYLLGKLTLIRQGQLGLVEDIRGNVRVVGPGFHLLETVGTTVTRGQLTDNLIRAGALSIIRVPPGQVGLGLDNGRPVVLLTGRHLINNPLFQFQQFADLTDPHIEIATTHLVTVQQGRVGLALVDATAHFLEPGRHHIDHPRFKFAGFRDSSEEHISIGSKHRVLVPAGRVGLAWQAGTAITLQSTGTPFNIDSPTFVYVRSESLSTPVIVHGSIKIVTVKQGFVGVSFADGRLAVLEPGRHELTSPTHNFAGFLSTGQQTLQISEVTSMSSDSVGLQFDAALTCQVVDAVKAVTMLAQSEDSHHSDGFEPSKLYRNIVEKAKLALSIIIGNNRLNATFRSSTKTARSTMGGATAVATSSAAAESKVAEGGAAPAAAGGDGDPIEHESFKQHVHDIFMHSFSESMLQDCGVLVHDMSIEDVKITNPELASAMARGAVARTDLTKAQIDLEVKRTNAQAEQTSEVLRAEGRARAIGILAEAEAARVRKLDAAMAGVSAVTQQRELILASAETLKDAKATILLAANTGDVATLLGNGRGVGLGGALSGAGARA